MVFPHGAVGWSAVCDFGISISYPLTFLYSVRLSVVERDGSVVECLTRNRGVAVSSSLEALRCSLEQDTGSK